MTTMAAQAKTRVVLEFLLLLLVPLVMLAAVMYVGRQDSGAAAPKTEKQKQFIKAGRREVPSQEPYIPVVYLRTV